MHSKFWLENLKGREHSENTDIGGRIILKWILQKQGVGCALGSCGSAGISGVLLLTQYKPSCSIKDEEFLD
jgi:hypothetical protein